MSHNNRIVLFCVVAALSCSQSIAQRKQFTMAEATNGMSTTLMPKGIKGANWQPGTDCLWQTEKKNGADVWTVTDYRNNASKTTANGIEIEKGKLVSLKWLDKDLAWYMNGKDVYCATLLTDGQWKTEKLFTMPDNAEHMTINKRKQIAYTIDNNLWLWTKAKGKMQVTNEANKNIVCGQSVHRDEFGIDGGIFFSPNGNYLLSSTLGS